MINLKRILLLSAGTALAGCTGAKPFSGNCKTTEPHARIHCYEAINGIDYFDDVLRHGADEVIADLEENFPEELELVKSQTARCDFDFETSAHVLDACLQKHGEDVTEPKFGDCVLYAITNSPTGSNRCLGGEMDIDNYPSPRDARIALYQDLFGYMQKGSIVVGEQAAPIAALAATDIANTLKFDCSKHENADCDLPDGMVVLDREVSDLYAQNRVLVGTFDDNSAVRDVYGDSREAFDADVIGPALYVKDIDGARFVVVTGQSSEDVRQAARYLRGNRDAYANGEEEEVKP